MEAVFLMLAKGIIAIAHSFAAIYITGFVCKTILIIEGDVEPEELKDWFKIFEFRKKEKNSINGVGNKIVR